MPSLSLSLVLRYVFVLTFFLLLNSKETFSSRLVRSPATVAEIGADDYPSTGRNTPVHDLGFPDFPSFQEATVTPPPDLPLIPPPPPDLPLLPPSPPYLPLLPPPPPYLPLLPPPPPDMPLLPPPPPYLPLLPPPPLDMPLLPPPPPPPQPFPGLEGPPRVPVPVWPSLPEAMPFPFIDQPPPSEPFGPRFDEFGNVMPSTPSNPLGLP